MHTCYVKKTPSPNINWFHIYDQSFVIDTTKVFQTNDGYTSVDLHLLIFGEKDNYDG